MVLDIPASVKMALFGRQSLVVCFMGFLYVSDGGALGYVFCFNALSPRFLLQLLLFLRPSVIPARDVDRSSALAAVPSICCSCYVFSRRRFYLSLLFSFNMGYFLQLWMRVRARMEE